MADLTPETLAEWREDAHDPKTGIDARTLELKRRILALLDALAEAETEVTRLTKSKAALVEKVKQLQDQIARAAMEPGQDRQKAMHAYADRAKKAEAEAERLRGVCNDWGRNYQSWVDATESAEQKHADLVAEVRGLADKWGTTASENVGLTLRHITELSRLVDGGES